MRRFEFASMVARWFRALPKGIRLVGGAATLAVAVAGVWLTWQQVNIERQTNERESVSFEQEQQEIEEAESAAR